MARESEITKCVTKIIDDYHDTMQEAQKTWGGKGVPLPILALVHALQIDQIISKNPEFELLLVEELIRQKEKRDVQTNEK